MDSKELEDIVSRPARQDFACRIRRLRLRLDEAEALDPNRANSPDLQSLEIGILNALADAFGFGTVAYRQFSAAGEFGVDHGSNMINVGAVKNAQQRAVALLRRAVQTKEEEFEDKYPGHPLPSRVRHPSVAGLAMAGATLVGSSVDVQTDANGEIERIVIDDGLAPAEAERPTVAVAFESLMTRVAVLEAALAAPKPRSETPIGPGHNGPPEFEPPFDEPEIQHLVDLLKSERAATPDDLPRIVETTNVAVAHASKLKARLDDFASAAVKAAGAEAGKRLVQLPWWLAVSTALSGVAHAMEILITALAR